jgi:hypothetical protein
MRSNLQLSYRSIKDKFSTHLALSTLKSKTRFEQDRLEMNLQTKGIIQHLGIDNKNYLDQANLEVNGALVNKQSQLSLNNLAVQMNKLKYSLAGTIDYREQVKLNLNYQLSDCSVEDVLPYFEKQAQEQILGYNPRGSISSTGSIKGGFKNRIPEINARVVFKNGNFTEKNSGAKLHDIDFRGDFSSGSLSDFSAARLAIEHMEVHMSSASIKAHGLIKHISDPMLDVHAEGSFNIEELSRFFHLDSVYHYQGMAKGFINIKGKPDNYHAYKGEVQILNGSIAEKQKSFKVENIKGLITLNENQLALKEVKLNMNKTALKPERHHQRYSAKGIWKTIALPESGYRLQRVCSRPLARMGQR